MAQIHQAAASVAHCASYSTASAPRNLVPDESPSRRTDFGHHRADVEEIYVVLGGGRVELDDQIVDLRPRDVVRVAPATIRELEAGPDGLELLATGTHAEGDGELLHGWWTE